MLNHGPYATTIPDLISEEAGLVIGEDEDEDEDVIRLARHRPYLQQQHQSSSLSQSHYMGNDESFGGSSSNSDNNGDNDKANSSDATDSTNSITISNINSHSNNPAPESSSNTNTSAVGAPTRQRIFMTEIVLPSKRPHFTMLQNTDLPQIATQQPGKAFWMSASQPLMAASGPAVPRRNFSPVQKAQLERFFHTSDRPSLEMRIRIASLISETEKRVDSWFQNRRVKARKAAETSSIYELFSPAASPSPDYGFESDNEDTGLVTASMLQLWFHYTTDGMDIDALPYIDQTRGQEANASEGNLGSSSVKYKSFATSPLDQRQRAIPASESKIQSSSAQILRQITPLLRGGSIASAGKVEDIVDLMHRASDTTSKRAILNALLTTRSHEILARFVQSQGLSMLEQWVKEATLHVKNPQHEDVLLAAIRALKALPLDAMSMKDRLRQTIKPLMDNKDATEGIQRNAAELMEKWDKFQKESPWKSSRSGPTRPSNAMQKRARSDYEQDSGSYDQAINVQEIFQLPKFVKASSGMRSLPHSDFFKAIGSRGTARDALANKENSRIQTNGTASFQSSSLASSASRPGHSFHTAPQPSSDPLHHPQHASTAAVHSVSPMDIDPSSSQHSKAKEALRKKEAKKTVRFKSDDELVAIRYIENKDDRLRDSMERDGDGSEDSSEQEENNFEDHYNSHDGYNLYDSTRLEPLRSFHPTPPTLKQSTPAFLMDVEKDIVWVPPPLLRIEQLEQTDPRGIGQASTEKYFQAEREATALPAIYNNLADIPPSPAEPDGQLSSSPRASVSIPQFNSATDTVQALIFALKGVLQIIPKGGGVPSHLSSQQD